MEEIQKNSCKAQLDKSNEIKEDTKQSSKEIEWTMAELVRYNLHRLNAFLTISWKINDIVEKIYHGIMEKRDQINWKTDKIFTQLLDN